MPLHWPARLWLVRHGQSAGNVARDEAQAAKARRIAILGRDVDVPLSALGERQSEALAYWWRTQPELERPDVVMSSPYIRAQQTLKLLGENGAFARDAPPAIVDERLREKEFGILDGLTTLGIAADHPAQAELRRQFGKFYHRPPGGEAWTDVILRLRSTLDTISLHHGAKRVLVVGHQVIVLCMRYLLEDMDEKTILEIDAEGDVANCAVTEYVFRPEQKGSGSLVLKRYNFVAPLQKEGTPVTSAPDANVAAR